jgi:NAD-dependent deacetylase
MAAPDLVILTGAGISRESGLATFRDPDGIWARVRVEDVATPEAFARDPARVHGFYNARRAQLRDPAIRPNAAHLALAALEARWPGGFLLVTQNVDDLHDRAGSRRLLHMHGELAKARCRHCEAVHAWPDDLSTAIACPACGRAGGMRPHVVWFGEMPLHMEQIGAAARPLRHLRRDRHQRAGLPGRRLRRRSRAPRPDHRGEPRVDRGHAPVRRGASRPRDRGGAGAGGTDAGRNLSLRSTAGRPTLAACSASSSPG